MSNPILQAMYSATSGRTEQFGLGLYRGEWIPHRVLALRCPVRLAENLKDLRDKGFVVSQGTGSGRSHALTAKGIEEIAYEKSLSTLQQPPSE